MSSFTKMAGCFQSFFLLVILTFSVCADEHPTSSLSDRPEDFIGIREHIGDVISKDLEFTDSEGKMFTLGEKIQKPVLFNIVYYRCPGICSPLLRSEVKLVDDLDLTPGKDYQILTISMDWTEQYDLAFKKSKSHYDMMEKRKNTITDWTWAVGEKSQVEALTSGVGFHYKRTADGNFAHAGTLMFLDRNRKIVRYLQGIDFRLFDIKMALTEASHSADPDFLSSFKLFLFPYSVSEKSYELRVDRLIFLIFIPLILMFFFRRKKRQGE